MISQEFIVQNFPQGEVTIVGGQPAMGKSSLATSLALSLAKYGKKSIFFSLGLSKEQLISRMRMQVGDEYYTSNEVKIIINDTSSAKLSEIQEQLDKERADYVIIDFLQLIDSEFEGSRSEQVPNIINRLKQCTEEFKVTIIIFSQLEREWIRGFPRPKTWGKRPTFSSLGYLYSKALDRVNIIFIHRPKYYRRKNEFDTKGSIEEENMEILKYKDEECIVSYLSFNTATTEITI